MFWSLLSSASLLCFAGCSSDDTTTTLVLGISSEFAAGTDLDRLAVSLSVNEEAVLNESIPLGTTAAARQFPLEVAFQEAPLGAKLSATLQGYQGDQLEVVRHLATQAEHLDKRLLVVRLERACQRPPRGAGPVCNEPSNTCIDGRCTGVDVPSSAQTPYRANWSGVDDICKPGGAPEVTIGKGQSDYLPSEDYELAQVEAGPQGGHHIWIALRVRNLSRAGSITEVSAEIPSLGLRISPLRVVFRMDPDEGGFCKLYGLRLQLDVDGDDIAKMLGAAVKVAVVIRDPEGVSGEASRWLTLSSDIK